MYFTPLFFPSGGGGNLPIITLLPVTHIAGSMNNRTHLEAVLPHFGDVNSSSHNESPVSVCFGTH